MTDDVVRKSSYVNPDKGQAMSMIAAETRSRLEKSARLKAQRLAQEADAAPQAPPKRGRKPKA